MPIGLTLPLAQTTSSLGYLAFSTREIEAARYDLKSLLLTNWGERPMHYYLGCNLNEYIFQPQTDQTAGQIKSRIIAQVSNWLPYVNIDNVEVGWDEASHGFTVQCWFSLHGRQDM